MMHRILPLLPLALLVGCERQHDADAERALPDARVVIEHPHDLFMNNLQRLCGNAYRGELREFNESDIEMVSQELVMHVRECREGAVFIPFHVGEDRSRTWIITRTDTGLRLKHDHRHSDGSEDEVTQYGGDTLDEGTPTQQSFHADEYTRELLPRSATNVWTIDVVPGELFTYHLTRTETPAGFRADGEAPEADAGIPEAMHGDERMYRLETDGRRFRIEFNLTETIDPPPAPWGYEND